MESIDGSGSRKPSGSSTKSLTHSPSDTGTRKLPAPALGVGMNGGLAPMNATWQPPRQRQVTVAHPASGPPHDIPDTAAGATTRRIVTTGQLEDEKARKARFATPLYPSIRGPSAASSVVSSDTVPSKAVDDLALGLRGLQVLEGYDNSGTQTRVPPPIHIPPVSAAYHLPAGLTTASTVMSPTIPPHRVFPYPAQPDFAPYYPGSPLMEGFSDRFMYPGYDSYRASPDPNLYAPSSVGARPVFQSHQMNGLQSPILDARPAPQFFYAGNQPFIYPPTPLSHAMVFPSPISAHMTLMNQSVALGRQNQNRELQIHQQGMTNQLRGGPPRPGIPNQRPHAGAHPYSPVFPSPMGNGMGIANASAAYFNEQQLGRGPPTSWTTGPTGIRPARRPDFSSGVRSPLLEEFRVNKSRKWELHHLVGHIVEFSADQHGSRFIQQKLEHEMLEEKQLVFDEVLPDKVIPLTMDVFGNYVVQKLFEYGNLVQRNILFESMKGSVLPLSLHTYGCRVVQKAVEHITADQQAVFVAELSENILRCVKDNNGNHVVQKLVEVVAPDKLTFMEVFKGKVYELSTHAFGCRVLQRCFEHLTEEQTRPLLDEVHEHATTLMQDTYGNYVVQFVLEHGQPQDRARIIAKLRGQMLIMAKHKYASNVCEKALTTADSESRRLLIDELMTPKSDGISPIAAMMKDQFANYVLQRALSVVEGDQLTVLGNKIRPHLTAMRRFSSGAYNKHLTAIEKLLNDRCPPPPISKPYHFANGIAMVTINSPAL